MHTLISYNVNTLKWTGDCFYGLQTFLEALAKQVGPISSTHMLKTLYMLSKLCLAARSRQLCWGNLDDSVGF